MVSPQTKLNILIIFHTQVLIYNDDYCFVQILSCCRFYTLHDTILVEGPRTSQKV